MRVLARRCAWVEAAQERIRGLGAADLSANGRIAIEEAAEAIRANAAFASSEILDLGEAAAENVKWYSRKGLHRVFLHETRYETNKKVRVDVLWVVLFYAYVHTMFNQGKLLKEMLDKKALLFRPPWVDWTKLANVIRKAKQKNGKLGRPIIIASR